MSFSTKRNVYCVSRATSSSGSPRNNRATIAILRGTEKRFGPFLSTRRAACASFGGALRRPFGLAPVIIRHVEYSG